MSLVLHKCQVVAYIGKSKCNFSKCSNFWNVKKSSPRSPGRLMRDNDYYSRQYNIWFSRVFKDITPMNLGICRQAKFKPAEMEQTLPSLYNWDILDTNVKMFLSEWSLLEEALKVIVAKAHGISEELILAKANCTRVKQDAVPANQSDPLIMVDESPTLLPSALEETFSAPTYSQEVQQNLPSSTQTKGETPSPECCPNSNESHRPTPNTSQLPITAFPCTSMGDRDHTRHGRREPENLTGGVIKEVRSPTNYVVQDSQRTVDVDVDFRSSRVLQIDPYSDGSGKTWAEELAELATPLYLTTKVNLTWILWSLCLQIDLLEIWRVKCQRNQRIFSLKSKRPLPQDQKQQLLNCP
uniref:Uncharacterized protein n=1 Tax=Sphaerodactylus townsendi TaxID=933632 RepID=A0ACB8ENH7_9SAUR